jgi:SAM-dependent methyltransferase
VEGEADLCCEACACRYEIIGGVPDLRLPGASWIDYEADREQARRLLRETAGFTTEKLVRYVFAARSEWDEARVAYRTRQVLEAPARLREELVQWLRPCMASSGRFLDVGCGPGALLAAAAAEGRPGIGVDVCLVWLLVARQLIADYGGEPVLAAALAESLPLDDDSVSGVISLDVIEHVADPRPYLAEISRVTTPGGGLALSTPNRYSLAAEPHVSILGVGWLPRSWQKRYVRWRSGQSYDFTCLLSTREVARLLRWHTRFEFRIVIPPVPEEEIAHFPPYRARLAQMYNRMVAWNMMRWVFSLIGPFFRVVGNKAAEARAGIGR